MTRRVFLKLAFVLAAFGRRSAPFLRTTVAHAQPASGTQPFDYAWLKGHARALAGQPYQSHRGELPASLQQINWDDYQAIRFNAAKALWSDRATRFQVQLFHLGLFFQTPVRIYEVIGGAAHELAYDPHFFTYTGKTPLGRLPADLGYAGFRVHFQTNFQRDIVAFLGASYFRAVGTELQYGMSSRGLAIDTGLPRPEEFPQFTAFWLEQPHPDSAKLTVYALLDSPSICGAYMFNIAPGARLVMDVAAALYPRQPIERLGIAPLTSMYQTGENDRRMATDWRPEIHDSDGLAMLTGNGEWIWRPLVNPAGVRVNSYLDESPHGFGLLQRDRNFDHYQDDGVFYERRPSLWVEPQGTWGKGAIQLVELPTLDETSDNIVAFWHPEQKPQPGEEHLVAYRLYWGTTPPVTPPLATVQATRTGIGGIVGQKRPYFSWRFAIDFAGGLLPMLGPEAPIEPVISASHGRVEITSVRPLHTLNGYRAMFDLVPGEHTEPVDLRLYLRLHDQPLTETWLYQYTPLKDAANYLKGQ